MAYELIGSSLHEWIGLAMFVLFVCHHLLNRGWYKNLFRGSYTPMRLLQTILAGLVLLTMLGAMVSSVPHFPGSVRLSAHQRRAKPWPDAAPSVRLLGLCAALAASGHPLAEHDGHGRAAVQALPPPAAGYLQAAGALAALYGLYAFFHRSIPTYLFLQSQFVFFDFEEPLIFFFLDYLAAMGLFV